MRAFLTLNQRISRQVTARQVERGVQIPVQPLTVEQIEAQFADPALAAAVKSLQAKLAAGAFTQTGHPLSEQTTQLARQTELREQRDELQKKLEQLNLELGEPR